MKYLKKVIYFFPFIISCIFYVFIAIACSFNSISPLAWIAVAILFLAGYLMDNNKWWGAIPGILVGILLIYMGNQETGQIIKETTFGIIMCIYYIVCGGVAFKK